MYETQTGAIRLPAPPNGDRAVARGARGHFSGALVIGEDEGRVVEFESRTERNVALVMIARPDVVALESQVAFHWAAEDGRRATHYFDYRLTHRDGSRTALMVKHRRKLEQPAFLREAGRIAAQVTPDFADRVRLISDAHIDPVELHNAELLHGVREADPEADAAALRVVTGLPRQGAARMKDLVGATGFEARGYRALVRLIRSHDLELEQLEHISHEALVRRRAA